MLDTKRLEEFLRRQEQLMEKMAKALSSGGTSHSYSGESRSTGRAERASSSVDVEKTTKGITTALKDMRGNVDRSAREFGTLRDVMSNATSQYEKTFKEYVKHTEILSSQSKEFQSTILDAGKSVISYTAAVRNAQFSNGELTKLNEKIFQTVYKQSKLFSDAGIEQGFKRFQHGVDGVADSLEQMTELVTAAAAAQEKANDVVARGVEADNDAIKAAIASAESLASLASSAGVNEDRLSDLSQGLGDINKVLHSFGMEIDSSKSAAENFAKIAQERPDLANDAHFKNQIVQALSKASASSASIKKDSGGLLAAAKEQSVRAANVKSIERTVSSMLGFGDTIDKTRYSANGLIKALGAAASLVAVDAYKMGRAIQQAGIDMTSATGANSSTIGDMMLNSLSVYKSSLYDLGISTDKYIEILKTNTNSINGMGLKEFNKTLGIGKDALMEFGVSSEDAAIASAALIDQGRALGLNGAALNTFVKQNGDQFNSLRATLGMTIQEFTAFTNDLTNSAESREMLLKIDKSQWAAKRNELVLESKRLSLLGLSAEQIKQELAARQAAANSKLGDRFGAAAKIQQLAGVVGMGERGARAADIMRRGNRASEAEKAELMDIISAMKSAANGMSTASYGMENVFDNTFGNADGVLKSMFDAADNRQLAQGKKLDPSAIAQKEAAGKLSDSAVRLNQFVDSMKALMQSAFGDLGKYIFSGLTVLGTAALAPAILKGIRAIGSAGGTLLKSGLGGLFGGRGGPGGPTTGPGPSLPMDVLRSPGAGDVLRTGPGSVITSTGGTVPPRGYRRVEAGSTGPLATHTKKRGKLGALANAAAVLGTGAASVLSPDANGGIPGIAADVAIIREILQKGGGSLRSMMSDGLQSSTDTPGKDAGKGAGKGAGKAGKMGGLLKAGGKLLKGGLIGATLGVGADYLLDSAVNNGVISNKTGDTLSSATTGMGIGATIGSVVPGIGTAIGAGIGGLLGGGIGLWKNYGDDITASIKKFGGATIDATSKMFSGLGGALGSIGAWFTGGIKSLFGGDDAKKAKDEASKKAAAAAAELNRRRASVIAGSMGLYGSQNESWSSLKNQIGANYENGDAMVSTFLKNGSTGNVPGSTKSATPATTGVTPTTQPVDGTPAATTVASTTAPAEVAAKMMSGMDQATATKMIELMSAISENLAGAIREAGMTVKNSNYYRVNGQI